ncbi:g5950 [Coccomyxa viridis]|uniref:G5950 protein n=1 Tax=Coccomyxa viridis TaxID=1274662 RepID=A0ABP1FU61_9CHLO
MHLDYAKKLVTAISSGNLDQAKAAYIAFRPYYDEIEVLCESFPDIDSDIDARPYAFVSGDASCDADDPFARGQVYQGSHMVEALLYRDGDLGKAKLYATELVRDSEDLMKALQNSSTFYAARTFDGIIDLATEIGSKKISSEEETYSDHSILIFYHNTAGMYSVYSPYHPLLQASNSSLAKSVTDAFTQLNSTLLPFVNTTPQGQTFTPYSQLTTSQRANVTSAAYNLAAQVMAAAAALKADNYTADTDGGDNSAVCNPAPVFQGTSPQISAGLAYLRALNQFELAQVDALAKAINSGNLSAAQAAYNRSRPLYEQIEVLSPAFKTEAKEINARAHDYDHDGGEDPDFSGFHKIEQLLYRDQTLSGAQPLAAGLQASFSDTPLVMEAFANLTSKLNDSSLFNGYVSFNGMNGLATSTPALTISTEEETYSHLSYMVFYNNWKGIYSQLLPFLSQNSTLQASMGAQVQKTFGDAFACLPIQTKDVWSDVSAANVTQSSVSNLVSTNWGDFNAANNKIRQCIFSKGFAVRDLVVNMAKMLGVTPSCDAIYLYTCGSASA